MMLKVDILGDTLGTRRLLKQLFALQLKLPGYNIMSFGYYMGALATGVAVLQTASTKLSLCG